MDQVVCVLNQRKFRSRHGGDCYEVKLVGLDDQVIYQTYVSPGMDNFERWRHILKNPSHGFFLEGLKLKRGEPIMINADSKFTILHETSDIETVVDYLRKVWS